MTNRILVVVFGVLVAVFTLFFVSVSKDWPMLYALAVFECFGKDKCVIDLSKIYGKDWSYAVWFPYSGAKGFGELDSRKAKINRLEFCDGLIFMDKNSVVVREVYSGCLDFPGGRDRNMMIGGHAGYVIRVTSKMPYLCVRRNKGFDSFYGGILPHYMATGCNSLVLKDLLG